jgi:CobQ-like glutamine amidotransferase family enzyme
VNESSLRLVWVYPDLLSTYGDQGNVLILEHRARSRGVALERVDVRSDQPIPAEGDLYLIGGGEDRPQRLAADRLSGQHGLSQAAGRGAPMLAVCAGFQLFGAEFVDDLGAVRPGLGLLDVRSARGEHRCVGEVLADVTPELGLPTLTGFENHAGITTVGPGATPLGKLRLGNGNGVGDGFEGAWAGRIIGTYLHGPVLARNPLLADLLLRWALGPLAPLDDQWYDRLRSERLRAVQPA